MLNQTFVPHFSSSDFKEFTKTDEHKYCLKTKTTSDTNTCHSEILSETWYNPQISVFPAKIYYHFTADLL